MCVFVPGIGTRQRLATQALTRGRPIGTAAQTTESGNSTDLGAQAELGDITVISTRGTDAAGRLRAVSEP